ncbi:MAG: type II toxin-antitoxin system ParD family antitoxin [Verrucomicrobiota bacterium]
MATQVIDLPPDLEQYVQEAVASGRFGSPSDVYRAALSLLRDVPPNAIHNDQELIDAINQGLDSASSGQGTRFSSEQEFLSWSEGVFEDICGERASD